LKEWSARGEDGDFVDHCHFNDHDRVFVFWYFRFIAFAVPSAAVGRIPSFGYERSGCSGFGSRDYHLVLGMVKSQAKRYNAVQPLPGTREEEVGNLSPLRDIALERIYKKQSEHR
jgi:hypothetical protein